MIKSNDPLIISLSKKYPLKPIQKVKNPFNYLVKSIVFQQLSTKAANTIYGRLIKLFSNETIVIGDLSNLSIEDLRSVGISRQKASYLHAIDTSFLKGDFDDFNWDEASDENIIEKLTAIKGVGEWTAQMVLIFALNRPDVWPVKDLGIKNAYLKHIKSNLRGKHLEKEMEEFSAKWIGYRSTIARLFWASLNN